MAHSLHKHINAQLDRDLQELKDKLLAMGRSVDQQVDAAISAFIKGDRVQAEHVVVGDATVNQLERNIDERCINVLAVWQPEASDLRFVAAVLKIVTDLERVGDLAVSTAEQAGALDAALPQPALGDVSRLSGVALDMLRRALRAFVDADVSKAQTVMASDESVKTSMRRLTGELRDRMRHEPRLVESGLATISVARHIERIAAHATNIAEMAVYIARGEDVRHHAK